MPPEVSSLIDANPWLLLVFGVAIALRFVGGVLAEASESWAKVLAPFGGQRWHDRAKRKKSRVRRAIAQDYSDMQRQIDRLGRRVTTMADAQEIQDKYLIYDADYHMNLELLMVENGLTIPLPAHIGWLEYKRRHAVDYSPESEP